MPGVSLIPGKSEDQSDLERSVARVAMRANASVLISRCCSEQLGETAADQADVTAQQNHREALVVGQ